MVGSIAESITRMQEEEFAEREAWSMGEYTGVPCSNCGRDRVCKCPNGKTRCEKCNWVAEDGGYCPISNR